VAALDTALVLRLVREAARSGQPRH